MSTLYENAGASTGTHREVRPEQVFSYLGGVRVIDVRDAEEFCGELGHIPGAELVPLASLADVAKGWSKDSEFVLVCRSGRRSEAAARLLAAAGFTRVMNLIGGMLTWNQARLPVANAR